MHGDLLPLVISAMISFRLRWSASAATARCRSVRRAAGGRAGLPRRRQRRNRRADVAILIRRFEMRNGRERQDSSPPTVNRISSSYEPGPQANFGVPTASRRFRRLPGRGRFETRDGVRT